MGARLGPQFTALSIADNRSSSTGSTSCTCERCARASMLVCVATGAYLDDGRYAEAGTAGSTWPVDFAAAGGGGEGGGAGRGSGDRIPVSGRNSTGDNLRPTDRSNA